MKNLLLEAKFDYGCLMILLEKAFGKTWDKIQSLIEEEDIYKEGDKFGRELEPHVTVLFGFDNGTDVEKIKSYIGSDKLSLELNKIDFFDNEKFDVLKFQIKSDDLEGLNALLRDNFNYTNDYDEYHPHLTIAYLKKGTAKKYAGKIKSITINANQFKYSDSKNKSGIKWD